MKRLILLSFVFSVGHVFSQEISDQTKTQIIPLPERMLPAQITQTTPIPSWKTELTISSWDPSRLKLSARVPTENTERTLPPYLSAVWLRRIGNLTNTQTRTGFAVGGAERTGTLQAGNIITSRETQQLIVVTPLIGFEQSLSLSSDDVAGVWASLSLAPGIVLTDGSPVADAQIVFSPYIETRFGLFLNIKGIGQTRIFALVTLGKWDKRDMASWGPGISFSF